MRHDIEAIRLLWGDFIIGWVLYFNEYVYIDGPFGFAECTWHKEGWNPDEDIACEKCRTELRALEAVMKHATTCTKCNFDWNAAVDHIGGGLPPWTIDVELKQFERMRWTNQILEGKRK